MLRPRNSSLAAAIGVAILWSALTVIAVTSNTLDAAGELTRQARKKWRQLTDG